MKNTTPLAVLTLFCCCLSTAADAPPNTRAESIAATAADLEAELQASGGSWEAWSLKLSPFRAALTEATEGKKWPWPAKDNYRFLGAAVRMMSHDRIQVADDRTPPRDAILALHRQLAARDVDLILMVVPDKLAIYYDHLVPEPVPPVNPSLAVKHLFSELTAQGVEVVDLYDHLAAYRKKADRPIYYDQDSHWRNNATREAAKAIAERLKRYETTRQSLAAPARYDTVAHERTGDAKADHVILIRAKATGDPYRDGKNTPVLMFGDSFSMYNEHLGAQLGAQLAEQINQPVERIVREGLAGDAPVELAKRLAADPDFLKGRDVIVWAFGGRLLEKSTFSIVELGSTRGVVAEAIAPERQPVTATVKAISDPPRTDAPYPDYLMLWHVTDLTDAKGRPIADGEAVLHVLAMKDRKLQPAAKIEPGAKVKLKLTPWSQVEKQHGGTAAGNLEDTTADLTLPHYSVEIAE